MKSAKSNALKWGAPALSPRTMSLLVVMLPCCSALVAASTIRYEILRKQQCARDLRQTIKEIAQLSAQLHPGQPMPQHHDDDHD